jgi:hypothetical protein
MIRLKPRSATETYDFHSHPEVAPRSYIGTIQESRIKMARKLVARALNEMNLTPVHVRRTIVEPGCGMADIGGWFSWGHNVVGFEAHVPTAIQVARKFPWMIVRAEDFQTIEPMECDVLVLCEILEHIEDPTGLCEKWFPHAKYAVISSPVQADRDQDWSAGGHMWSFDPEDFPNFFEVGGHEVLDHTDFEMGPYAMKLLLGRRKSDTPAVPPLDKC